MRRIRVLGRIGECLTGDGDDIVGETADNDEVDRPGEFDTGGVRQRAGELARQIDEPVSHRRFAAGRGRRQREDGRSDLGDRNVERVHRGEDAMRVLPRSERAGDALQLETGSEQLLDGSSLLQRQSPSVSAPSHQRSESV